MRLGIDFDNTIVCYDDLFWTCAREQGLVDDGVARNKRAVRDAIRRLPGGNDRWTELQGLVYGRRILEAVPAPGLVEFLERCQQRSLDVVVISHKTLHPAAGPSWNLHEAARGWLDRYLPGLPDTRIFLELTLAEKLRRIRMAACTHFVDDLEELFTHPDFPRGVSRILYEPERPVHAVHDGDRCLQGIVICRSWKDIAQRLLPVDEPRQVSVDADAARLEGVSWLLEAARGATVRTITPLQRGANSSVYRVDAHGGGRYALKLYPLDPSGDVRLAREFSFLRLLREHGLGPVPEPVAEDPSMRLALYGFLAGEKLTPPQIGRPQVAEACGFVASLQDLRQAPGADLLAPAAEACLSIDAHIRLVQGRMALLEAALSRAVERPHICHDALALVRDRLHPVLDQVTTWIGEKAGLLGISTTAALPRSSRILTPSDFGFHNILRDDAGRLAFVDFEYAGWDDPAKTLVDFFHQPERPVPPESWSDAVTCLRDAARAQAHRTRTPSWFEGVEARATLLYPLLGVKWCLIMLNVFRRLPAGPPGASPSPPPEACLQLGRAREKLEDVQTTWRNGAPWTI